MRVLLSARWFPFQIVVEPGCDLAQAADAVFWLAAAAELMVFSMEQAHSGRNTVHPQSGEHLDSIGHPAAVVLIRLDKEGRCLARSAYLSGERSHISGWLVHGSDCTAERL